MTEDKITQHKKTLDLYKTAQDLEIDQIKFGLSGVIEYGKIISQNLLLLNGTALGSIPFFITYLAKKENLILNHYLFLGAASMFLIGIFFLFLY